MRALPTISSVRRSTFSLVQSGLFVAGLSTSFIVLADPSSAASPGMNKGAPMGNMDVGHKHMKMTGNEDHDFAMMMRMHHEKGIKMAQRELDKGKDPYMRAAAQKIIDTQKKEIAEFDKWLAEHSKKSK